jgi:heme-degrading monooxygenase HmoA
MVITRWRDKEAFDSWVHSDAFKEAHGRGDGAGLLRGHPQMGTYEIAVKREPGVPEA